MSRGIKFAGDEVLKTPSATKGERPSRGQVCKECGGDLTEEAGEKVCTSCGLVLDDHRMEVGRSFDSSAGRGITLNHLPDKNLATTFRPADIKDSALRSQFERMHQINMRVPQRGSAAWVYYRRAQELRPILERVYPPYDVTRQGVDKVGKVLEFASHLTMNRPLPQSMQYLKESLAYLCIVHSDPHVLLPFRLGSKGLSARILGFSGTVEEGLITTEPKMPVDFALKTSQNGKCVWETAVKFLSLKPLKSGEEDVELMATLTMGGRSFNVGASISIYHNVLKHSRPLIIHRRLDDEASMAFLSVSKQKCTLNDPVRVRLSLQPAPKNDDVIRGKLQLRVGKKVAMVLDGYKQLCQHYSLPVAVVSPTDIILNDMHLKPDERSQAIGMAKLIDSTFKEMVTFQRLRPEIVAALAVIKATDRSVIEIAERYRVDPGTLRGKLAKWQALLLVGERFESTSETVEAS